MAAKIAARMNRMAPSGIRKVNEKALAMERAGEKVLHFEIGRPDFDTPEYIKRAAERAREAGAEAPAVIVVGGTAGMDLQG